eukprot:3223508-Prymnesium_polylepis.1
MHSPVQTGTAVACSLTHGYTLVHACCPVPACRRYGDNDYPALRLLGVRKRGKVTEFLVVWKGNDPATGKRWENTCTSGRNSNF